MAFSDTEFVSTVVGPTTLQLPRPLSYGQMTAAIPYLTFMFKQKEEIRALPAESIKESYPPNPLADFWFHIILWNNVIGMPLTTKKSKNECFKFSFLE